METFRARRSGRYAIAFIIGFVLWAAGGVWTYVSGHHAAGILVMVVCLIGETVIIFGVASPNSWYRVGIDRIVLRKGFAHRDVHLRAVRAVTVVPEALAPGFLRSLVEPLERAELEQDVKQWWRAAKAYGRFVRFCSVPMIQSRHTAGNWRNIVSVKVKVTGDFVVLELDDGEALLLSPRDCEGFAQTVRRRASTVELRRMGEGEDSAPHVKSFVIPETEEARRRSRRRYTVIRAISFVVIGGIAVTAIVVRSQDWGQTADAGASGTSETDAGESGSDSRGASVDLTRADPAVVNTWIDEDTFRFRTECSSAGILIEQDQAQREEMLLDELDNCWDGSVAGVLMDHYFTLLGALPSAEEYSRVRELVLAEVRPSQPVLLQYRFDEDVRVITAVITISSPGLRGRIATIFEE